VRTNRESGAIAGGLGAIIVAVLVGGFFGLSGQAALAIIARLLERGAAIRAHDPVANETARRVLGGGGVAYFDDMYETLGGADALVLATEWDEFRALDFGRCAAAMRGTVLVDGRNIFDPGKVRAAGLRYLGVGRIDVTLPAAAGDESPDADHPADAAERK